MKELGLASMSKNERLGLILIIHPETGTGTHLSDAGPRLGESRQLAQAHTNSKWWNLV